MIEIQQGAARVPCGEGGQIVAEQAVAAEDARVRGVKAENQADAEHIQAL